jgi:hypothetical protein
MNNRTQLRAAVAMALLVVGCTGSIGGTAGSDRGAPGSQPGGRPAGPGNSPGGPGGTGPGGMGPAGGARPGGEPAPALELPAGALRRLTARQYANTVRDLLGAQITVPEVEADLVPEDEFILGSVAAAGVAASPRAIEQYDAAARDLARQLLADPAAANVVGCAPATADAACIRRFLASFGRRAWRRSLTDEELGRYSGAGLEVAIAALLASPHFLYRVELGAPGADGRRVLGDDELATRLAYTLWDTTPDAALLEAAGRGDLIGKPEVLRSHVERLLASPRARQPLLAMFSDWLGTNGLDRNGLVKDAAAFPAATPALARAMYQEIEALVAHLVFDSPDADLLSLYDSRQTFVTAELARLYGLPAGAVPPGDSPSPVTLPPGPRAGFLTTGAFLALNARSTTTSPTLRGMFIRERLLCQTVPAPPDNVDTTLPPPPPDRAETMRERLVRHMGDPACASCHALIDPPGLALENFDALGAYRSTDAGRPLDVTGSLDGDRFDGPQQLAGHLRAHPQAAACLLRQLVQHATGTHDHRAADAVAAALTPTWMMSGGQLRRFLAQFAASDLFRTMGDHK